MKCQNLFSGEKEKKKILLICCLLIMPSVWYMPNIEFFRIFFFFFRDILITAVTAEISYEDFCAEIKDICKFDDQQPFTMKWVDEEGRWQSHLKVFLKLLNLMAYNCSPTHQFFDDQK